MNKRNEAVISMLWSMAVCVGAAPVYVSGLAPNWDQPNDYPDAYDGSRVAASHGAWDDWCVPASGVMLLGHWEDVRGLAGLADGSADGNQGVAGGYGGPAWGAGAAWHDYTADGDAIGGGPSALRGTRPVNDLGWYMDTNNLGSPARGNGVHPGTFHKDTAPGLNDFFGATGSGLSAATFGVNAAFGGLSVPQLANAIRAEIDANRTAIAHFAHWNLLGPAGPGQGLGTELAEGEFPLAEYSFGPPIPGDRGEVWNGETGLNGLGHAALVVGYDTDPAGMVTDLIVHDNWPTTVRNVQVPVGSELVAITTVVPEPATAVLLATVTALLARSRRR